MNEVCACVCLDLVRKTIYELLGGKWRSIREREGLGKLKTTTGGAGGNGRQAEEGRTLGGKGTRGKWWAERRKWASKLENDGGGTSGWRRRKKEREFFDLW